ncbi:hypothetical protein R6Z07F_009538 [Ovis aries]
MSARPLRAPPSPTLSPTPTCAVCFGGCSLILFRRLPATQDLAPPWVPQPQGVPAPLSIREISPPMFGSMHSSEDTTKGALLISGLPVTSLGTEDTDPVTSVPRNRPEDTFPIALTSSPVRPGTLDTFAITRSPAPVRPGTPHPNPSMRRVRAELIPALRLSGKQKPGLAGGWRARKEKEAKSRSLAFWPDFLGKERCGRSVCARREGLQARWRAARAPDARPGSRAGSGRRRPHNGVISASALQRPPLPARSGTDCPGAPRLRTHSLALGRRVRQGTSKAPSSLGIADAAMLSCIVFLIPLGRTRGHESPGEGTNSPRGLCDAGDPRGAGRTAPATK